jgi:hypothetical protein
LPVSLLPRFPFCHCSVSPIALYSFFEQGEGNVLSGTACTP